jgi:hypothetical protein
MRLYVNTQLEGNGLMILIDCELETRWSTLRLRQPHILWPKLAMLLYTYNVAKKGRILL